MRRFWPPEEAIGRIGANSIRGELTLPPEPHDPQGQESGGAASEGAHPVEGGHFGSRRRLERQPDRRGFGDQRFHGLPSAQAAGGRRARGCLEPQGPGPAVRAADFRRREGSAVDRSGMLQTARGARALELAAFGEQGGGARPRRGRQRQHDPARAQKNALRPHRRKYWVIPPKASGAFVAAMEDVLSVYTRPRDPDRPVVRLDETSKQLVAETPSPVAMRPGLPARVDYEYARNGVANLFMMFAPLEGWRHVKVTDRRTAVDYAHVLKDLADVHFAQAETIVLVQDNLNTHATASLYEAFPAAEARRLVERFEWHHTPKHGSWLNLAESELGVLASQCLDRRIPDKQTITDEVAAWVRDRNKTHAVAEWHFSTNDARIKLKSLYPLL